MGIQINGATDSITAIDGTIDVVSAIGNAGVVTATAFVGNITGNVTGNINHTSNLELQVGGVTRANINSSGQLTATGKVFTENNLGIRNTVAGAPLHVKAPDTGGGNIAYFDDSGSGAIGRLMILTTGGTASGDGIKFQTVNRRYTYFGNATNHLTIDNTNARVGIATDNPGGTLDVLTSMGRIKFNNSGSIGSRIDFANANGTVRSTIHNYGGSNEILSLDAPSTIQFRISNSPKVEIKSTGQFHMGGGSGWTYASQKFVVVEPNNNLGMLLQGNNANEGVNLTLQNIVNANNAYSSLSFADDGGQIFGVVRGKVIDKNANTGELQFWTSGSQKLTIDKDGNAGIGEDDPDDLLSIKKSSSTAYDATATQSGGARLSIFNSNNTLSDTFADIHFKCHSTSSAEARIGMRLPSINNSELFFITENNNNLLERLRITNTGRLKINHTHTTSKLNDTWLSIYDANSDSSAIDPAGISKNYAMISLHNYGTGVPGDSTGIGFGAGSSFGYTKGSIAFARSGSYGTGDLVFLTNNDQDATMVNDTDEKMRITRDDKVKITGVVETGPKTITGGTSLAIQNFAVKGVWSGVPSIGKSIELISGYDSSVKMAAIGYNLTDTSTGSTYGGDLTFHTQPLYSSPQTPIPESMRISSSGYVTKPKQPAFGVHSGSSYFTHGSDTGTINVTTLSTELFDTTSSYDTGTNIYTAPVTGKYFMSFMYDYKCTSGYLVVILSKAVGNGSFASYGKLKSGPPQQSTTYSNGQAIIGIMELDKGDRVRPQVQVNYAGNQLVNCHWSGYLLG